jgi:hypothetical protein
LEAVAFLDQIVSQFNVIEDFTIKSDPYGLIFIGHRLVAPTEIDDAQSRMSEPHRAVNIEPRRVRTSMVKLTDHSIQESPIDSFTVQKLYSENATHTYPALSYATHWLALLSVSSRRFSRLARATALCMTWPAWDVTKRLLLSERRSTHNSSM